ncbi:protein GVQW3-like [Uloborus diversus]|uniref:protein GVQW3-like n=1 Tax=Uloborus diversus TaxID=327109 RepID=UPI00240A1B9A|nr:protein GVQW3-like [Uloborus diversus]
MERTIEQRLNIKFCVKLKKTPTETLQIINEVYGEEALSRTQVFQWHKNFREGRDDVHDEQRAGRPSTSHTDPNVQKVREVLNTDCRRRMNIRAIAEEVGMDKMNVHDIVENDLGMRKICAKLVPNYLTDEQKERRLPDTAPLNFFLFPKVK